MHCPNSLKQEQHMDTHRSVQIMIRLNRMELFRVHLGIDQSRHSTH